MSYLVSRVSTSKSLGLDSPRHKIPSLDPASGVCEDWSLGTFVFKTPPVLHSLRLQLCVCVSRLLSCFLEALPAEDAVSSQPALPFRLLLHEWRQAGPWLSVSSANHPGSGLQLGFTSFTPESPARRILHSSARSVARPS